MSSAPWRNPWRQLPRLRWAVQLAYLAFLGVVGVQFALFVGQALSDGPVEAPRPAAVEAFLPIAALLGLKRLALTGRWDPVHPAGLTILVAALAVSLVARKGFCSWVCPVGTLSRMAEWAGSRLFWRQRWPTVPRWLDLGLSALKYALLAFFLLTIIGNMPVEALEGFIFGPYNVAADAKMLAFFRAPSATFLGVVGFLVALSLVVKHAWCRWLCPYGALLGLFGWLSPIMVRRDPEACHDCLACTKACPAGIQVHTKLRVLSPDCTGCLSCVASCGSADCLTVTAKGKEGWHPLLAPALVVGGMLAAWVAALLLGGWRSEVGVEAFRWAYRAMGVGEAP